MIIATKVNRAPETQASTISSSDSNRCKMLITTAVKADNNEAHMRALYESAVPTISLIVSPSPVIYRPARILQAMTATGSKALMALGGNPGFMAKAASSSCPTVDFTGGAVMPVERARRSAFNIGPNSRPVVMISTTKNIAING